MPIRKKSNPKAIIIMGVAGSGKTTVGQALAQALGWPFFDGDDYHSNSNVKTMAAGTPLTDTDRHPWLDDLHDLLAKNLAADRSVVLACSALKRSYRKRLVNGLAGVTFIFLKGDFGLLHDRLASRRGHYMPLELLKSQIDLLEEPIDAIIMDISKPLDEIVDQIVTQISVAENL